ncbi:hypothetical protein [Rhizobium sp. SG2393]|uniref:hypothetical protein n=1 Tax=Rhizobium sp. SG2393 TaxID=3276279 RepID=UPI00366AE750
MISTSYNSAFSIATLFSGRRDQPLSRTSGDRGSSPGFAEHFGEDIPSIGSDEADGTYSPRNLFVLAVEGEPTASGEEESQALFEDIARLARMSPAELVRAKYLSDHDMTEDSLKALPDSERQRIEAEITEQVKSELGLPTRAPAPVAPVSSEPDFMTLLDLASRG